MEEENSNIVYAAQSIGPAGGPPEVAVQLLRSDVELWRQVLQKTK